MTNNNLPSGWNKQQSNIPKAWGKSVEKANEQKASAVNGSEPIQDDVIEPIVETSDHTVKDDNSNSAPAEQKLAENNYKDLFDGESESKPDIKKPKVARKSIIVLVILLIVSLCLLAVFAILYFRGSGKESNADEQQIPVTTPTSEHTKAATQKSTEETVSTELPTVKETAEPTTAEPTTVEKATESGNYDDSGNGFESYLVNVINDINYYEKPDYTSKVTGHFTELTIYTVVDETYDETGTHWGKLKSGAGWFNITEATDEYYNQRLSAARRSFMQASDTKFETVGDVTFSYYPVFPVDQHTPVEDGYYTKIDSLSVEYVGDRTYTLHITGEYQNYNDVPMQLCCRDLDNSFHTLNTYSIGEPFLNDKFECDASIHISNNTSMVFIEFNRY